MEIRLAASADIAGIFAIYDPVVLHGTATFETVPKTMAERAVWFAAHAPDRHPLVVAVENDAVVGWAGVSQWSPRQAYDRTAESSVYVAPESHGRGIGRALMLDLIPRCRAAGLGVLLARIVAGNPASLRLHERLGYGVIGTQRRAGEKFGQILDVILMDLHLDGAGDAGVGRGGAAP